VGEGEGTGESKGETAGQGEGQSQGEGNNKSAGTGSDKGEATSSGGYGTFSRHAEAHRRDPGETRVPERHIGSQAVGAEKALNKVKSPNHSQFMVGLEYNPPLNQPEGT
jgi:hypothetical protein